MTHSDRETIQRVLGIIAGVTYFADDEVINALNEAEELLKKVLNAGEETRK